MDKYYKIVEIDNNKRLKTLFHGVNKSRVLEIDVVYTADKKIVDDGGTKYLSGFHIIPTMEECIGYLKKFKNKHNKKIVLYECEGIRPKAHSPSNVFLADKMRILEVVL